MVNSITTDYGISVPQCNYSNFSKSSNFIIFLNPFVKNIKKNIVNF